MQQFKLLGIQPIRFTASDGNIVSGTNLFLAFADENVTGLKCQKFFLKEEFNLPECKPNDNLHLTFDMKGRIVSVEKV